VYALHCIPRRIGFLIALFELPWVLLAVGVEGHGN